jgi:negative regulator of genetic competence, sporulation and motility
LFVTKVGTPLRSGEKEHLPCEASPAPKTTEELRQAAFCFDTMEKLLTVCRRLAISHRPQKSKAFTDDGGRYWLLITEKGDAARIAEEYIFIPEYGKIEDAEAVALRLTEHGRVLCADRAVEILGEL